MINKFNLVINDFKISYDKCCGIDCREGWSVAIKGSFYVLFEKRLLKALYKSYKIYKENKYEK